MIKGSIWTILRKIRKCSTPEDEANASKTPLKNHHQSKLIISLMKNPRYFS